MTKVLTENRLNKLLRDYILELSSSGEYVPEWIFDAQFCYDERLNDCVAQVIPETNTIVYGDGTTVHAILHELEHLRSRHKDFVRGYDDELERFVNFYFVGYRTSGGTGLFLEEALDELSARMVEMKMFGTSKKERARLISEYKTHKYYNFEIYMTLGLCSLLGINVEDVRKLKYTGDTAGQDSIKKLVGYMAGDERYWHVFQEKLDDYEVAKRLQVPLETRRAVQKERLYDYYKLAYALIVRAHTQKMISAEDAGRAIYLFEEYSKKAGEYCDFAESARTRAKESLVYQNKSVAKLFANSERCIVQQEDEKNYAVVPPRGSTVLPVRVAKVFFESVGKSSKKTSKYELLQENMYGL